AGHAHVQQDDVGTQPPGLLQRVGPVHGLADDVHVPRLQQGDEPGPHDGVVVHHQCAYTADARAAHCRSRTGEGPAATARSSAAVQDVQASGSAEPYGQGSVIVTVVPSPGAESTVSAPPTRRARSAMPTSP